MLIGGAIGGLVGGAFGFANSAVSQLMSGKGFDSGKAWGAAANGAIVGAVKGAVAGSGVGLPLAIAADFAAGTIGSAVEQGISEGVVDVGKSIAGGLTNAVNGLIYGNDTLRSLGQAAVKGAASGALTSGINYLADVTGPQPAARRSPGIQYQGGAAGMFRPRDPKRGCVPSDPSIGSLRYGRDYGYQYNVPASGEESQSRRGFSLCDFMKEMLTGAVTGGMAGATFYGAGRAVSALKESIKRSTKASNITYRALNQKDYDRYSQGLGLEAKNPNGNWGLKEHIISGSGKKSWLNDPYISTTTDLSVAQGFNNSGSKLGIVVIDMDKVSSASYKGYEIFSRLNGKEGLPYHYSIWQQETSVYQSIPRDAIIDYMKGR